MIFRSLFFITFCFLVGCTKKTSQKTILYGKIVNPTDSIVSLYFSGRAVDSAKIDAENHFSFQMNSVSGGLYYLKMGNQFQYLHLENGDSLLLSVNTFDFDKSAIYSGKGAEINNFLIKMSQKIRKEQKTFSQYYALPPYEFQQKMDSIYANYINKFNLFLEKNENLSEKAIKMAWASFFFDIHKFYELYLFEHLKYVPNEKNKISLSKYFYNFRKEVNYNDLELSYYPPFYQYLTSYVDNIAYNKHISKQENNKILKYQLNKLKVIDTIFHNQSIKDNLLHNASFSYLLEVSDQIDSQKYVDELNQHLENQEYKKEIEQLHWASVQFQKESQMLDLELFNSDGKQLSLSDFYQKTQNVVYFWSSENQYAQYLHFRINQLAQAFPKVNFIGIEISGDVPKWNYLLSELENSQNPQLILKNFPNKFDRYLIKYNENKALIVNKKGVLQTSFVPIFSPKMEEVLTLP